MTAGNDPERTYTKQELAVVFDAMWQELVAFPFAQVCKHHAAGVVLQRMESLGIDVPEDVVRAVVFADDETALAWRRDACPPSPAP